MSANLRYSRVTLYVPWNEGEESAPELWDWDALLDSALPVVFLAQVEAVTREKAIELLVEAGYDDLVPTLANEPETGVQR